MDTREGDTETQTKSLTRSGAPWVGPHAPSDGAGDTQGYITDRVIDQLFCSSPTVTRIGRYIVLGMLGQGGMGTVYAAYDEQLDRKIALKVLAKETLASEAARLRFQREAQALARLTHVNVATVYEVGVEDGEMYLAMEFIRGQDLSSWIGTKPAWQQVLEVFIEAGRGLVAAHEAGVIHRDLKPHNIMRSDSGVVKLLDFGLARTLEATETELGVEVSPVDLQGSLSRTGTALTQTGAVMGTPAYMSPEQRRGEALDTRSDQYSFCVAFYEALYGERPSQTQAKAAHRSPSISEEPIPVGSTGVPTWLHRIVARGLSPEPQQRWPSMAALLEALLREPAARRRRRFIAAAGVGVLGLVGLVQQAELQSPERPCEGAIEHLRGVWDEGRRAEVDARIEALELPYADHVWSQMDPVLEAYASDWVAMHTEACEATAIRKEQSARMLDLRMRCLSRAARGLRATVDMLAEADAAVMRNALDLMAGLEPLARCEDIEALDAEVPPPRPEDEEAVEAARQEHARARALAWVGRGTEAQEAIAAAKAALHGVEYGPVWAEQAFAEGDVLARQGELEASEARIKESLELASQWGPRYVMADAAAQLVNIVGLHLGRPDEGLQHWPLALGLSRGDPLREANARHGHGTVLQRQGKHEEAEAQFRAALEILGAQPGSSEDLTVQGMIWRLKGAIATTLAERGRYEEAEAQYREVLDSGQGGSSSNVVQLARVRSNIATVLRRQKRYEEAELEQRAALAVRVDVLEPGHPDIGESRNNLATILRKQGRLDEAEREYRTALAILVGALGTEHPSVAVIRNNLARVLWDQGKHAEAEAEHLAAIRTAERVFDSDHPMLVTLKTALAESLLDAGRPSAALDQIEGVWDRSQGSNIPASKRARAAFLFARILSTVDAEQADRARARRLAEDAVRAHREAANPDEEEIAEIQRWLGGELGR